MVSDPWLKFTTRITPKMTVNPAATRNSDDAPANPVSSWTANCTRLATPAFSGRGGHHRSSAGLCRERHSRTGMMTVKTITSLKALA